MTTRRSPLARPLVALALAGALTLSACGDDEPEAADPTPAASETSSPTPTETTTGTPTATPSQPPSETAPAGIPVTIEGDAVSPMAQEVELGVGETLSLDITSDRAGELHVHSNPEQTFEVATGEQTIEITFDKPGQVDIEEHVSEALLLRVLVR